MVVDQADSKWLQAMPGLLAGFSASGCCLWATPALAEYLGLAAPAQLLGHTLAEDGPLGQLASGLPLLQQALTGVPASGAWQDHRATPPRQLRLSFIPVAGQVLLHMEDQTALHAAEQALQQARRQETFGHMAGGIAHDFNNALATMLGYARLSLDWYATDPDSKVHTYLSEVLEAGRRARELIRQLLAFSRGQDGIERELQLVPLVKEIGKMLLSVVPPQISLEVVTEAEVPPVVSDPVLIQQMLLNLVMNSREAMLDQGRIAIRLYARKALRLPGRAEAVPANWVVLEVTDDGCGMAPEVLERAFEPAYTTKQRNQSSGMGLPVVRTIARQAGGEVWLDSRPAIGTVARIYLPPAEVVATPGDLTTPDRSLRVLIVDDDPAVAGMIGEFLRQQGHRIEVRNDSRDAWLMLARKDLHVDLLITDEVMPHITGIELVRRVRRIHPALPVLLITGGYSIPAERPKGVLVLNKPVDLETLLANVALLTRSRLA